MNLFAELISMILPPRCAFCGKTLSTDKGICDDCITNIEFLNGAICYRCGHPLNEDISDTPAKQLCLRCQNNPDKLFRLSRSAFVYDDFSKKLILDFKFYDRTDIASLLGKIAYVAGKDIFDAGIDIIIPVPLHYTRLIKRKYNQASLIAKELGKLTATKVEYRLLLKHKITRPQVDCSGAERLKNLKNAFCIKNSDNLQGKRILLIDDVYTTGSTLRECAKTLHLAHPASIDTLTVARVIS